MNLLALAAIMLMAGLTQIFLNHNLWLGGATIALAAVMVPVHFIRARRSKRYDQSRTFE